MAVRSTRSILTFPHPFTLSGRAGELPAGRHEVLIEEELLQELSFTAYRKTATYLTVRGTGRMAGRTERHATTEAELETALARDGTSAPGNSAAALYPPEI